MVTLKRSVYIVILLFTILFILCVFSPSCNSVTRNNSHPDISDESIIQGKKLAAQYCQSCHMLPDPSLLDSKSWEKGVLPHMGPRLGIFEFFYQRYPNNRYDRYLPKDFYPAKPVVSLEEWKHILDYYIATAPDSLLPANQHTSAIKKTDLFEVETPALNDNSPATSYIKIDTSAGVPKILLADLSKQAFFRLNQQLRVIDSLQWSGRIVDVVFQKDAMLTCDIGSFMPTNEKLGKVRYIHTGNHKMQQNTEALVNQLARPVQLVSADLNKDGKQDYIVCEFGYLTGALCWMENKGNGKFDRHVLRPLPGAIKVYVDDYNKDGLPDLWVLFSQGEEGIFLFTNKGNGQFDQQEVLRFPPVYGSSYFEMDDFNKDGYPDIVYTCGDNADYSTILKPYHGMYLFLNDGKNHFKQQYFYHINGCYKAIARDFDGDGDLDLATIAYFADFKNRPEEGFVYLENKGDYHFSPYTIPETQKGRWLTMDAGDMDGDGKIDVVLGNFSIGPAMLLSKFDWKIGPPFMVLKNTGKTGNSK